MTRRDALAATVSGCSALAARGFAAEAGGGTGRPGLVIHSFPVRTAADAGRKPAERFADPFRFLEYGRSLGAGCVQVAIGPLEDARADALRERAATASMHLEGIVTLPRDEADLARFEAEVRASGRAGATIARTVTLKGRRYETFDSLAAFRRFGEDALASLKRAAPVAARWGVRLAVENHKDWRADELLDLLRRLGRDDVGVCLDTGNSMALLEDPMEVVEALAPLSLTTHFKDMGVAEHRDGFLLAEVPLGAGVLDLDRIVRVLRRSNPSIRLNLEMITRDPLEVPCLSERYWTTFPDLPGRHLARMLAFVRSRPPKRPLPRISALAPEERLRVEDENVRRCLDAATAMERG